MSAVVLSYSKLVTTTVANQAVNLAESGTMGHRIQVPMSLNDMNRFFVWHRPAGSSTPVGHFSACSDSAGSSFAFILAQTLSKYYTDIDGVTNGLNFSSAILDANPDPNVRLNATISANDIIMAYVIYKLFGSSSAPTQNIIYNLNDAQDMLTNDMLISAIQASLANEESNTNNPGTDKGAVNAMFHDLLSIDPTRFFTAAGNQIPGLFEVAADTDSSGSWGFVENDKIEMRVQFTFSSAVTLMGAVDTSHQEATVTVPANTSFIVRLQLTATDTPSGAAENALLKQTATAQALADQAARFATAAVNAQTALSNATQAANAAATQSANAIAAYNEAVQTNAAQAIAVNNAQAALFAAQAALAAAKVSGSPADIQQQNAAAVAAQAAFTNAQAIASQAATAIQNAATARAKALAVLEAAQTAAANASAANATAAAQAAAAQAAAANAAASVTASTIAAANAASDPATSALTQAQEVVLNPQTLVTLLAKANSATAARQVAVASYEESAAYQNVATQNYTTASYNLNYAIEQGSNMNQIQILKAATMNDLNIMNSTISATSDRSSTLFGLYNAEFSAIQLAGTAATNAASLRGTVSAASLNGVGRILTSTSNAYVYASTMSATALSNANAAQTTLNSRISGGATMVEVQSRTAAMLAANTAYSAAISTTNSLQTAYMIAQQNYSAVATSNVAAQAAIPAVAASNAAIENLYQTSIAASMNYQSTVTAGANLNQLANEVNASLIRLNDAMILAATADEKYKVAQNSLSTAIAAGGTLGSANITALRSAAQAAADAKTQADLILQTAQADYDQYLIPSSSAYSDVQVLQTRMASYFGASMNTIQLANDNVSNYTALINYAATLPPIITSSVSPPTQPDHLFPLTTNILDSSTTPLTLTAPSINFSPTPITLSGNTYADFTGGKYVSIPFTTASQVSMIATINVPTGGTSSTTTLFSLGNATNQLSIDFLTTAGNPYCFINGVNAGTALQANSTAFPIEGSYAVAVTLDNTTGTANLYMNGSLAATLTGLPNLSSAATLYLGRSVDNTTTFTGAIKEFSIYTSILTSTEIVNIYSGAPTTVTITGQTPVYTFTSLPTNNLLYYAYQLESVASPALPITSTVAAFTQKSKLTLTPYTLPTQATIAFWMFPLDNGNPFSIGTTALDMSVTSTTITLTSSMDPATPITATGTFLNMWVHVAVTLDGTGNVTQLYLNGVSAGTASGSALAASTSLTIAADTTSTTYFNGYMSNFEIYSTLLTQSQITALASLQSISASTPTIYTEIEYMLSARTDGGRIHNAGSLAGNNPSSVSTEPIFDTPTNLGIPALPAGLPAFASYNNQGDYVANTVAFFDPNGTTPTDPITTGYVHTVKQTISFWMYASSDPAANNGGTLLSIGTDPLNTGTDGSLNLSIRGNYLSLNVNMTPGGLGDTGLISTAVATGAWNHVAIVINNTNYTYSLYMNGVLQGAAVVGTQAMAHPSGMMYTIGTDTTGTDPYQGYMSDFSTYSVELSQANISKLASGLRLTGVTGASPSTNVPLTNVNSIKSYYGSNWANGLTYWVSPTDTRAIVTYTVKLPEIGTYAGKSATIFYNSAGVLTNTSINSTGGTVTFLMYPLSAGNPMFIGLTGSSTPLNFRVSSTGITITAISSYSFTVTGNFLNTWTAVALTVDIPSNTVQLYLNGTLAGTIVHSSGALTTPYVSIGVDSTNTQFFNGYINTFSVYDVLLTTPQITALANGLSIATSGTLTIPTPVGINDITMDAAGTLTDAGTSPQTITPGTAGGIPTFGTFYGKVAADFTGGTILTLTQPALQAPYQFSIAFNMYINSTASFNCPVSIYSTNTALPAAGFQVSLNINSGGIAISALGASAAYPYDFNQVWTHVVLLFDAANPTVKLYINGVLATSVHPTLCDFNSSWNTYIGGDGLTSAFNGYMNSFQVFNSLLTQAQITSLYATGAATTTIDSFMNVANMLLWLDANDTTGTGSTVSNGTRVSTWKDKSGQGNDAVFASGVIPATIAANGSSKVLQFNNSVYSLPLTVPNDAYTMFVVQRTSSYGGSYIQRALQQDNTLVMGTDPDGNVADFTSAAGSWAGVDVALVESISSSEFLINSITQSSGTLQPSINGSLTASLAQLTGPLNALTIGGSILDPGVYLQGKIAEVMIFGRALTTSQRETVEGYLAWKWGIQASLPNSHTFRSVAPFINVPYATFQLNTWNTTKAATLSSITPLQAAYNTTLTTLGPVIPQFPSINDLVTATSNYYAANSNYIHIADQITFLTALVPQLTAVGLTSASSTAAAQLATFQGQLAAASNSVLATGSAKTAAQLQVQTDMTTSITYTTVANQTSRAILGAAIQQQRNNISTATMNTLANFYNSTLAYYYQCQSDLVSKQSKTSVDSHALSNAIIRSATLSETAVLRQTLHADQAAEALAAATFDAASAALSTCRLTIVVNPNVSTILKNANSLRNSQSSVAKTNELIVAANTNYQKLQTTSEDLQTSYETANTVSNELSTLVAKGASVAQISALQNEYMKVSAQRANLQHKYDSLYAEYLNISNTVSADADLQRIMNTASTVVYATTVSARLNQLRNSVNKAKVEEAAAETAQLAAQANCANISSMLLTAVTQGKTLSEITALQTTYRQATSTLASLTVILNLANASLTQAQANYTGVATDTQYLTLPGVSSVVASTTATTVAENALLTTYQQRLSTSIASAMANSLTTNLTNTFMELIQASTLLQEDIVRATNLEIQLSTGIAQGYVLADISSLSGEYHSATAKSARDKLALDNLTKAYTNSLTIASRDLGAESVLITLAKAQSKIIAGANSNKLLDTLQSATETSFSANHALLTAQSAYLIAKSAVEIATANGDTVPEMASKLSTLSGAGAILATAQKKANDAASAIQIASMYVNMDPNSQAILAAATAKYVLQNAKAQSNVLMDQYRAATAAEAATYAALSVATNEYTRAQEALSNAITAGGSIASIQALRDASVAAGIAVSRATTAEKYAMDALNTAIENASVNQIAQSLIVTARLTRENSTAGGSLNSAQEQLDIIQRAFLAAQIVSMNANAASQAAQQTLANAIAPYDASNNPTGGKTQQEISDMQAAASAAAAAASAAQTAVSNAQKNVLNQSATVSSLSTVFGISNSTLIQNIFVNNLLYNGFAYSQSVQSYVLDPSMLPEVIEDGVSFDLYNIRVTPSPNPNIYSPTVNYSLGNQVYYPDMNGNKYMCISYYSIINKDPVTVIPVNFSMLWVKTGNATLRYNVATDIGLSGGSMTSPATASFPVPSVGSPFAPMIVNGRIVSGNTTILTGLTIFGPGVAAQNFPFPTIVSYSRGSIIITSSGPFLPISSGSSAIGQVNILNARTVVNSAVSLYDSYVSGLVNNGLIPDTDPDNLTGTFLDTTQLPGSITANVTFSIGTTSVTPVVRGVYSPTTTYSLGDMVYYPDASGSLVMCVVGPNSLGPAYSHSLGVDPVDTPFTSPNWYVVENRGWDTWAPPTADDLTLSAVEISGNQLYWTNPENPPNMALQLPSTSLQGYSMFGTGINRLTHITNFSYGYSSTTPSVPCYIATFDQPINPTGSFYVKNGARVFDTLVKGLVYNSLATAIQSAGSYALNISSDSTVAQADADVANVVTLVQQVSSINALYPEDPFIHSIYNIGNDILEAAHQSSVALQLLIAKTLAGNTNAISTAQGTLTAITPILTAIQAETVTLATYIGNKDGPNTTTMMNLIDGQTSNITHLAQLYNTLILPSTIGYTILPANTPKTAAAGKYILVSPSSPSVFAVGTGDYTFEFITVNCITDANEVPVDNMLTLYSSGPASTTFASMLNTATNFGISGANGSWTLAPTSATSPITVSSLPSLGYSIGPGFQNHFACVRQSGTTKVYLNGSNIWSGADSRNIASSNFIIGSDFVNTPWMGGIRNVRFSSEAIYTSNFNTSPTITSPTGSIFTTNLPILSSTLFVLPLNDGSTVNDFSSHQNSVSVLDSSALPVDLPSVILTPSTAVTPYTLLPVPSPGSGFKTIPAYPTNVTMGSWVTPQTTLSVSWTPSTSPAVSGYTVRFYSNTLNTTGRGTLVKTYTGVQGTSKTTDFQLVNGLFYVATVAAVNAVGSSTEISSGTVYVNTPPSDVSITLPEGAYNMIISWTNAPLDTTNDISNTITVYSNSTNSIVGGTVVETITGVQNPPLTTTAALTLGKYYYATVTEVTPVGQSSATSSPTTVYFNPMPIVNMPSIQYIAGSMNISYNSFYMGPTDLYTVSIYTNPTDSATGGTLVTTQTTVDKYFVYSPTTAGLFAYATITATNTAGTSGTITTGTLKTYVLPIQTPFVTIAPYTSGDTTLTASWGAGDINIPTYTVTVYSNTTSATTGGTLVQSTTSYVGTSITISSLIQEKYYYVTVMGRNPRKSSANTVRTSNSVQVISAPGTPASASMNAWSNGQTVVTASWPTTPLAATYNVNFYYNTTNSTDSSGATFFESVTGVAGTSASTTNSLIYSVYYFATVTAVNTTGSSLPRITSGTAYPVIYAPTNVAMSAWTTSSSTTPVTWTASSSIGATYTVSFYSNSINSTSGGTLLEVKTGVTGTTASPTANVSIGTYYYASVTANLASNSSTTITTPTAVVPIIFPPTNVAMTAWGAASTTTPVTWTPISLAGATYTVVFYTNATNSTTGGTLLETKTGVTGSTASPSTQVALGTYYYATVQATTANGNSTTVTTSTAVTPVINPPSAATMSAWTGQTSVTATWTASTTTAGLTYTVSFYSAATNVTTGGTLFETFTGVSGTSRATTASLVYGNYYYATVTAVNILGNSSTITTAGTVNPIIGAPTNVAMTAWTASSTTTPVTWTASTTSGVSYTVSFYTNVTNSTAIGTATLVETKTGVSGTTTSPATQVVKDLYYFATVQAVAPAAGGSSSATTSTGTSRPIINPASTATMTAWAAGQGAVTANWTASTTTAGVSYTVSFYYAATNVQTGGTLFQTFTGVTGTTKATTNTLVFNVFYYATVTAVSPIGSSTSITTAASPSANPLLGLPTNVAMATWNYGQTSTPATWTASTTPGATYTVVFYSNSTNSTSGGTLLETQTGVTGTTASPAATLVQDTFYYATVATTLNGSSTTAVTTTNATTYYPIPVATKFNPFEISGMQVWLDAQDILATGTAPTIDTLIASWKDKSGAARNCSFTNVAKYVSGSNYIHINYPGSAGASSGTVASISPAPIGTFASNFNAFVIQSGFVAPVTRTDLAGWAEPIDITNNSRYVGTQAGVRTQVGGGTLPAPLTYLDSNAAGVWGLTLSYPNSNVSATGVYNEYFNGTNYLTQSSLLMADISTSNLNLLARNNTPVTAGGKYYEVMLFNNAMTTRMRQGIEGYLAWKWGLQTSLPSSHPYAYHAVPRLFLIPPSSFAMNAWAYAQTTVTATWVPSTITPATSYTVTFYTNSTNSTTGGTQLDTQTVTGTTANSSSTMVVGNYYYATLVATSGSVSSSIITTTTTTLYYPIPLNQKFSPDSLGGVQIWLDATDVNATGTNPSIGTSLSSWNDKSGFGRNCAWFAPVTLVDSNGRVSLSINSNAGTSNVGVITTVPIGAFSNYFNAFVIQNGYDQIINRGNPATYAAPLYMSGNARYVGWGPGNNRAQVTGTFQSLNTATASGPAISQISLEYPGATSNSGTYFPSGPTGANMGTYTEYFNGVAATSSGTYSIDDNGSYPVFLLQGNGSVTQKSLQKGNYYEVLLFGIPLTTTQRQAMEGYLAWKWNMVSSLPANHPYATHGVPIISLTPPTSVKMVALATAQTSVTVNWVASTASAATSYTVVFYQANTRATSGGTVLETQTGVTGTTASSTVALTAGKYYYATVTTVGTTIAGAVTSPSVASTGAVLALSPTGTFNPLQVPDVQVWLDGTDIVGNGSTTAVNTTFTTWYDKSTNGRNCSFQSNVKYMTGNFIGVNQSGGQNAATILAPSGTFASNFNMFVVQKGYDQPIARTDNSGWPGPIDVGGASRYIGYGPSTRTLVSVAGTPNMATLTSSSAAIWHCSMSYPNGSNAATGTWAEYVNGTLQASQGSLLIADTAQQMYMMTRGGWTAQYGGSATVGNYYEIIAFSGTLTTNQRQIIEGYLAWKWSLQSTLPAGHPYKSVAPTASATQ